VQCEHLFLTFWTLPTMPTILDVADHLKTLPVKIVKILTLHVRITSHTTIFIMVVRTYYACMMHVSRFIFYIFFFQEVLCMHEACMSQDSSVKLCRVALQMCRV
jgi:hypothetical protein